LNPNDSKISLLDKAPTPQWSKAALVAQETVPRHVQLGLFELMRLGSSTSISFPMTSQFTLVLLLID